ncbi:ABC transporter substrate-binding protein [Thermophilibacter provencensis]|uniref:ABC transporter substrate-binding protein n=1 Tax=Thermophilibacter provencensis TaxID=1852386 RepID=A0ABT7V0R4_9ACTN|nr:ABC transporter substrate-binding protein [Thermophilibacter provencensis]MDM8270192.1 ABC transporter substrate-binding protein [Thermophilibacter provencensis]
MSFSLTRRGALDLAGALLVPLTLAGCSGGGEAPDAEKDAVARGLDALGEATPVELAHATQFSLDSYDGGYRLATLASGDRLLIVPENATAPEGLPDEVAVVQQPLENVYLVSTGMICLVDAIGALGAVGVSSVRAENSPAPAFTELLESGEIAYGGIYRSPDYELIAAAACPLAIENTNIDHVPEVRAKLEELGVVVLMEQSSREEDMLGRLEWIRLMGTVFGREDEAAEVFKDVAARVEDAAAEGPLGKTVTFFYINEDGAAVTRRAGDYFAQMIEAAGGEYVSFAEEGAADSSPTTVTVEMEAFFAGARDADVIIYNGTIDDGVTSLEALSEKNSLLADFKAVREGNVWTCDANLYQQMTSMADIIEDFRTAFSGTGEPTTYIWKLG